MDLVLSVINHVVTFGLGKTFNSTRLEHPKCSRKAVPIHAERQHVRLLPLPRVAKHFLKNDIIIKVVREQRI